MTEEKTTKKQGTLRQAQGVEEIKFKGKYIQAIGRRKTSVARIRLYKSGQGIIVINGLRLNKYFSADKVLIVNKMASSNKCFCGFKTMDSKVFFNHIIDCEAWPK